MNTTNTRQKFAVAVGAAIAGAAAPALLFLGAGTAQAVQDSEANVLAIIDHLPTPRGCPSCGGFNPQPDSPGFPDPGSTVGVGDAEDRWFNPQPDPPGTVMVGDEENFGDEVDYGDEVNYGDAENLEP